MRGDSKKGEYGGIGEREKGVKRKLERIGGDEEDGCSMAYDSSLSTKRARLSSLPSDVSDVLEESSR